MLCRDCCCGTSSKHPRTDHEAQRDAFESLADEPHVEVRVVDCLDECERSNVVLVRRNDAPRKQRDTWLGSCLTPRATDAVTEWVRTGASPDLPPAVRSLAFRHVPPRRR